MKVLVVVDMQNDFLTGPLGSPEAEAIIPNVKNLIGDCYYNRDFDHIIFTQDTHEANYLDTQEGANLPVPHCLRGSYGWEIPYELTHDYFDKDIKDCFSYINKPIFGSETLAKYFQTMENELEEVVLCGVCTDICVISNAMILKSFLPEVLITVDASCCAGVTPDRHTTALAAMQCCQINVVNE